MHRNALSIPGLYAVVLLAACGSSLPPALSPTGDGADEAVELATRDAVLQPGERFAVDVRLRGVMAGELAASVGTPCRLLGRRVVPVRAAGRSTSLVGAFRDVWVDVRSLVDTDTGLALQTRTHKKVRTPLLIEVERDGNRYRWRKTRRGRSPVTGERALPGPAHDVQSFVAMLRGWRPDVRPEARAYVLVDRRLWLAEVMFRGREVLDTNEGQQPAVRVDGVAQRVGRDGKPGGKRGLPFSLWIADDRYRAPLRFVLATQYGELQADLTRYRRPPAGGASTASAGSCSPVAEIAPEEIKPKSPPAELPGLPGFLAPHPVDDAGPGVRPVEH
jgi:hypothetical protein